MALYLRAKRGFEEIFDSLVGSRVREWLVGNWVDNISALRWGYDDDSYAGFLEIIRVGIS